MDVYLRGSKVTLVPAHLLGQGGEAEVYRLGPDLALKVFKTPDHPDYRGSAAQRTAAQERLEVHQQKLAHFPAGLPEAVIAPRGLATDRKGRRVLGYLMRRVEPAEPLLRYADVAFRRSGVANAEVLALFHQLHATLSSLHGAGVVVGDLNDANILVHQQAPFLIDADSFQFGPYLCRVFTERFVDPLHCDPAALAPTLNRPFSAQSDWYAFATLLIQSLLCVGPHGGIYRPTDPAARIPAGARPLRRVTLFHPQVQYPKPARPLETLPDGLLHHLHRVFVEDLRTAFPLRLIEAIAWRGCPSCGLEHARPSCPRCAPHASAAARTQVIAHGEVRGYPVCEVRGVIVHAAAPTGALEWVAHQGTGYFRETGERVWEGPLNPELTFQTAGRATYVLRRGAVTRVEGGQRERWSAEVCGGRTGLDTGSGEAIWTQAGQLVRRGTLGLERLGEVLEGQTRFWTGRRFGLGFYRAGNVVRGLVFSTRGGGVNDRVPLPELRGTLVDAGCVLADGLAWFWAFTREGGRAQQTCWRVSRAGAVLATSEVPETEQSWQGQLPGACAVGEHLFVPTDAGILRVEGAAGGGLATRLFADTEPFVDGASRLVFAPRVPGGAPHLCVVSSSRIVALEMS